MNALAPFLGRFVAILIAWVCGHLAVKYNIIVSNDTQQQLANEIVNFVTGLLVIYAGSHKIVNKWLNPGDAASSHLAEEESLKTAQLKARPLRR